MSGANLGGPGRVLGGSWARRRRVLGCSWACWSAFGRLLGCLGLLLALLGGSGALLGAKLELSWSSKGTTSTPKNPKIKANTV